MLELIYNAVYAKQIHILNGYRYIKVRNKQAAFIKFYYTCFGK